MRVKHGGILSSSRACLFIIASLLFRHRERNAAICLLVRHRERSAAICLSALLVILNVIFVILNGVKDLAVILFLHGLQSKPTSRRPEGQTLRAVRAPAER